MKSTQKNFEQVSLSVIKLVDSVHDWRGKNFFYCKAKCLTGPTGFRAFGVTFCFVSSPLILFLSFNHKVRLVHFTLSGCLTISLST